VLFSALLAHYAVLKREDAEKSRQVVDVMYVAIQALNAVSALF
jgi:hypothetical protein